MVFARRALSGWTPLLRQRATAATRSSIGRQTWRQARGYASVSGQHGAAKSSDATWAAGAVLVTAPALYFIGLHKPEEGGHGHGDHGEEHEEHEESNEESEEGSEAQSEESEPAEEQSSEDGAEKSESESDSGDEKQDTPETSDDEDAKDNDSSKGDDDSKTEEDTPGKNKTVKYPDAKGGIKNRKESQNAITAGQPHPEEDTSGDKGKTAKQPAGGVTSGSTSGKQEGVSNTDTKHSYDLDNDTSRSKKSEGGPDTAKVKGSVDPQRATSEKK